MEFDFHRIDLEVDTLTGELTESSLNAIPKTVTKERLVNYVRDNQLHTILDQEDYQFAPENL